MIASKASLTYTNGHTNEERFMLKLTKKKVEDDELGIFGAEKYFKGVLDEEPQRASNGSHYHPDPNSNQPQEKHESHIEYKQKTPSSVRSESSWNSRRGLLVSNNGNDHRKKKSVKSLLVSLGCNCNDEDSIDITDKIVHVKEPVKQPVKGGDIGPKVKSLSNKRAENDVHAKKFEANEVNFTFPVLSMKDVKHPVLPEIQQAAKKSFSLERKLKMLNWDGVTPRAENLDVSRNGLQNDTASDTSSDLFEIESFSTNENNSFFAKQTTENINYAPSEVSVDWSVVTASAADFSTSDDFIVPRTFKSSGILSGCKSHKAVRVSGDEYSMAGGIEKALIMTGPSSQERCRRLDSVTPLAKIQADTKLIGVGSDLHRSQNGFCTTRPIPGTHSVHASHHLYMSKKTSGINHLV
uniref:protein PHYTOCHROME KINASE SUBSTRATE 1-like n=1 Tax=Erigeron canadensis TaxID=72917 RepID=UPI001CB972AE|nr:protein PHYTOCHROME KINASE SUBSTRATE 1-like [Erigeron canadensis]